MTERRDPVQRGLELACRYVDRRERTESEIRRHLASRHVEDEAVEAVVAELVDSGLINDARYIRLFTEDKRELARWGTERIRRTLLQRGIDRDLLELELASADELRDGEEAESELDRALALLRRRFPAVPRERRDRDRALGMLLRKGYESELAFEALSAYAREAGSATAR